MRRKLKQGRFKRIPLILWGVWISLWVLPGVALHQGLGEVGISVILIVLFVINSFTILIYWLDKRKARNGEWRVPEIKMHLLEFLGGWPAAFLAQRIFHHKVTKRSYQVRYWLIVIFYQCVAVSSLSGWLKNILIL